MFERRHEPLLSRRAFAGRLLKSAAWAGALVLASLGLGILGYMTFGGLGFIDAVYNASMILTGMGPVDPMRTIDGKLFASAYALFSGLVFVSAAGVLLAPVLHRIIHHFHLDAGGR